MTPPLPRSRARLPYTVPGRSISLIHYSNHPNLEWLDPAFFGRGRATPRDFAGLAKSFAYVHGSPLGADKPLFQRAFRYQAKIPTTRIYDLSRRRREHDPLNYLQVNRAKADQSIKALGYAGVRLDCPDGRRVAVLFEPVRVTRIR